MVSLSFLGSAGHAFSAVAALEKLQAVSAFPAVARAHLALRQHWLADARPEVSGAAQALRAICRPQAGVTFHAWENKNRLLNKTVFADNFLSNLSLKKKIGNPVRETHLSQREADGCGQL